MSKRIVKFVKRKTSPLRTEIVKKIAPTIYGRYLDYSVIVKRPTITFVKSRFRNKPLVGCEIGVAEGDGANLIFETLNITRLFLVDPWLPYDDGMTTLPDRLRCGGGELRAREQLAKYGERACIIKKLAEEAVDDVDEPLDFIFIDGNHSYPFVKVDIANYYPKVKAGGVCGGHDYSLAGVGRAVDEFIAKTGLVLHRQLDDWWVIK